MIVTPFMPTSVGHLEYRVDSRDPRPFARRNAALEITLRVRRRERV
jgi:hypothetical protein